MKEFQEVISKSLTDAFRRLLSEKHLYQSVELDLKALSNQLSLLAKELQQKSNPTISGRTPPSLEQGMDLATKTWIPNGSNFGPPRRMDRQGPDYVDFDLPTINTFCSTCDHSPPSKPVYDSLVCIGEGSYQRFYVGYVCQQCNGWPIQFLVSREGMKLRLCGRDPIEVLPTPKVIPKAVSRYYSDAHIAHHAGQTLAGLFLLRVFIEQYWRSLIEVKNLLQQKPRATGDEQAEVYQATLPTDFKDRFPSLKEVYGQISAALHEASANTILFDKSSANIVKHFEARRLFDLP